MSGRTPVPPPPDGAGVTPRRLGIVADDLTGAADSAVPFAAGGATVFLLRDASVSPDPDGQGPLTVLAVATGTRALGPAAAAERTVEAVRDLLRLGCDRIYLKVDSTMRGSVAGQLRGALAAWSTEHAGAFAVLCPAFPGQGRTVLDGEVLVHGTPLHRSAASRDPVTPVVRSFLSELVPGSLALGEPVHSGEVRHADASSDLELDALAATIDGFGPAAVAAGSAGLASALARRWATTAPGSEPAVTTASRILVAVSSLHPTTAEAVERVRESGVDVLRTPAGPRGDAARTAHDFGIEVAERLRQNDYDALVLVGGDGAAAVLDRVGATGIALHSALLPGSRSEPWPADGPTA